MADLKGKRVSTGSPGKATKIHSFRMIEAARLDEHDMKHGGRRRRSVNAIKDGKINTFYPVGGLPTASVTDLADTPHQAR